MVIVMTNIVERPFEWYGCGQFQFTIPDTLMINYFILFHTIFLTISVKHKESQTKEPKSIEKF